MTTTTYSFGDYKVSLALEKASPLGPLVDLHICHLGMRFIAAQPLTEYSEYEFEVNIRPVGAGEPIQIRCRGVVVKSEPEGSGYRVVIHFHEISPRDASCLETVSKANGMRCEYCANC